MGAEFPLIISSTPGYYPVFVNTPQGWRVVRHLNLFENGEVYPHGNNEGWFNLYIEADKSFRRVSGSKSFNLLIGARMKRTADLGLNLAQIIPTKEDNSLTKKKMADVWLPKDAYEWSEEKDALTIQEEGQQNVFNLLHLLNRKDTPAADSPGRHIGWVFKIYSYTLPITRTEAKGKAYKARLAVMDPQLTAITSKYVDDERNYDKRRKEIEAEQKSLTEEYELLNKNRVGWIGALIKPIAEAMIKEPELQGFRYEIYGPFGMNAETSIHFTKGTKNVDEELHLIEFVPGDLDNGEIMIRDYTTNTHEYEDGSMGELNGMNHPSVHLPNSIRGLVEYTLALSKKASARDAP